MGIRWSLTNKKNVIETKIAFIKKPIFRKELDNSISFGQFKDLTKQFKVNSEDAFGAECALDISVLNSTKTYTTFVDEFVQDILDAENKRKTTLETNDIDQITEKIWEEAGYVEVSVRPSDKDISGFGHVEFKGNLPEQATFSIWYEKEEGQVKKQFIDQYSSMIASDGSNSNGTRNTLRPLGLLL